MDFVDLAVEQDDTGTFDIVFTDGGLGLDFSLTTSIAASLFTDSYAGDISFGGRRGKLGIYFGNIAWTRIEHSQANDEETAVFARAEYDNALQNDFVSNNVWNFTGMDVQYILGSLYINVDAEKNSTNKDKFSVNFKITGDK